MRTARCQCRRVAVHCAGEPVKVSVCHCLDCQRRSGSAFSTQARFASADVTIEGAVSAFVRVAESGRKATFRFCPACGSTVAYQNEGAEDLIAVPVGLFEGALSLAPMFSYFEHRKLAWASVSVASDGQHLA